MNPAKLIAVALLVWPLLCWSARPTVEIRTNFGPFQIELYDDKAPRTVENFLRYARSGFYRNTLLHRLVPNVLLQAGAYDKDWRALKPSAPIQNEADNGLSNSKWSIAMAHGPDPHSATSEFFINLQDNDDFDFSHGDATYYCVFGEVVDGHETLKKMLAVGVIQGGDFVGDQPTRELIIDDVRILNE